MSRVIKRFANIEFIVILQLSHKRKVEGHISTQMRVACVYVCVCVWTIQKRWFMNTFYNFKQKPYYLRDIKINTYQKT